MACEMALALMRSNFCRCSNVFILGRHGKVLQLVELDIDFIEEVDS